METPATYTTAGTAVPTVQPHFVDVRNRRGKLLFRFDPARLLVDWRAGHEHEVIDLTQYMK